MKSIILYFSNILVSIDQFINTLLGGSPDETISSRAAKKRASCAPCRWLCNLLELIDKGHCDRYIEEDEGDRDVLDGGSK